VNARRALHKTNGSIFVKPLVVLAVKTLGPGPLRLKMVKLAHDLSDGGRFEGPELPLDGTSVVQPTQRAA